GCRVGRRHAGPRAPPHRCRRKSPRHSRLARAALRDLDQLQTDGGACCMAAVACADRTSACRRLPHPPSHSSEGPRLMGWLILLLLIALALGALWLFGVRAGWFKAAAAALLLGASGYGLQGSPGAAGAPAPGGEEHDFFPLTEAR